MPTSLEHETICFTILFIKLYNKIVVFSSSESGYLKFMSVIEYL